MENTNLVLNAVGEMAPNYDRNKINLETNLKYDLGIDSLRMVELIVSIEEQCNLSFNESDLNPNELNSVGDFVELINKYL